MAHNTRSSTKIWMPRESNRRRTEYDDYLKRERKKAEEFRKRMKK